MSSKADRILQATSAGAPRLTSSPVASSSIPRPGAKKDTSAIISRFDLKLYQRDRDVVRELSAFVAGEGRKLNTTVLIRAALLTATKDEAFLNAYDRVAEEDPRRTRS